MSDEHAGAEHLNLRENFPAVPTDTWEDAIRSFLEGAPETELVWHSDEGLVVHPYYRSDALAGLQTQTSAIPGQFPFVRGPGREWKIDETGLMQGNSVRADLVLEAGGDSIQQLGIAIAEGVEKLTVLGETRSIDLAAREIQFVFGIGSTYFFEIAKLRAARMLWARVVEQFKPINLDSCGMNLHARTVRINKSFCDPHTNILRATTEAMAAGIGGCDSLTVEPFAFDRQIAINIQRVLAEEAHLNIVAHPRAAHTISRRSPPHSPVLPGLSSNGLRPQVDTSPRSTGWLVRLRNPVQPGRTTSRPAAAHSSASTITQTRQKNSSAKTAERG